MKSKLNDLLEMTGCRDEADLQDMANVGKALMERVADVVEHGPLKGWSPADCPTELVTDLANELVELRIVRDAAVERLQAIIDWADLAMRNPQEFDSHGVRNLDGPVFDAAREFLDGEDFFASPAPQEAGRMAASCACGAECRDLGAQGNCRYVEADNGR